MKNWYLCGQCKKIYLRDEADFHDCDTCGKKELTAIKDRFILRCKKCGLTQIQRAYLEMGSRNALKCQNSGCDGIVKAVILGGKTQVDRVGDNLEAPLPGRIPTDTTQKHPAIPQRRNLSGKTSGIITSQSPNTATNPNLNIKNNSISNSNSNLNSNANSNANSNSNSNLKNGINSQNNTPMSPNVQNNSTTPGAPKAELFNFFGARPLGLGKVSDLKIKDHPGIQPGDVLEINEEMYEILGKIGTGGMGAVHKAQNIKTKDFVAIKEFYYTRYHDPESGENKCEHYWDREQKISQIQSDSPEKCMHYVGSLKLTQFQIPEYLILIEFIEGKPMDKWYLERYKTIQDLKLSELRMIIERIFMPMARHMHFVHERGVVHRDLTVQNIMITETPDGPTPVIIDWGVAKYVSPEKMYKPRRPYYISSAPEATGIRNRGTPPEVMAGFEPIAATDIYMLGHVLYYILSGGHYCGTAATNEDFVLHPADLNPDLPPDFNKLVEYMTQYEPADRMPSMVKVHEALKWILDLSIKMEKPAETSNQLYLYCDYNESYIPLTEKKILRLGKEEIIAAGQTHEYDGHLFNALIPIQGEQFQLELYLDGSNAFIRDLHSKLGTYLNNLTMPNQQVFNNVAIKGLSNCYIPLSDVNLGNTTIEIPFIAPDGVTYRIPFKIIRK